jgi:hypothetical protein
MVKVSLSPRFAAVRVRELGMRQPAPRDLASQTSQPPVAGELLGPEELPDRRSRTSNEQWAKLLSFWTDSVFEVPVLGWRFGLDPIIGLVPVVGDLATTAMSFYILSLAIQAGVPRSTMARMTLNAGIDYVIGSIPLIGNVFDFAWKANRRNMQLLERALATPAHERRRQSMWDWLIIGGVMALLLAVFIGSIALAIWLAAWTSEAFRRLS